MKIPFFCFIAMAIAQSSYAQWNTSGNNIFNTNTGNIGIGTTSPAYKLDVTGSGRFTSGVFVPDGQPFGVVSLAGVTWANNILIHKGYNTSIGDFAEILVPSGVANSASIRLLQNGNVGIGTLTPGRLLDLEQSISGRSYLRIRENSASTVTNGGAFLELAGTRSDGSIGYYGGILGGRANSASNNQGYLAFYVDNNDGQSLAERIRIDNAGNVGIGTTSPAYKLDVTGSGRFTSGVFVPDGQPFGVVSTIGVPWSNNILIHKSYDPSLGDFAEILVPGSAANSASIRLLQNGNVGIGATAPDARLSVNGTIHAKEVKVDLTGWPDYVFKTAYKLPSLDEVKKYIDQNHHLPDMPSEAEIVRSGLNLGQINTKLVKKLEELTLYLIDKNKQINELRNEVTQLKQEQLSTHAQQDQINQLKAQLNALTKSLNKN